MATFTKRETGRGVRWTAQVYVGRHPATGKPQLLSKTFERKGDAEKWVRKQESMKDAGARPSTSKETLAEYLVRWLPIHAGQVRAVTVYNYRASLNRWVIKPTNGAPPIGSLRLNKLTVHAFDQLYAYMRVHGIKPRGCRYLHGILRRALNDAVKKGEIPKNPTDFATVPKEDHSAEDEESVVEVLEKEEAARFLAAAREDRHSALFHVLLLGALRPCEAFALRWPDVDFETGAVRVTRTLTRIGLDRKEHPLGWKLTRAKTKRSHRTVPLPEVAMKELRKWRLQQAWERRTFAGEYQDHGFVFTSEVGSPLDLSNLCRGPYTRVMERAELGEYVGPEPKKPRSGPTAKRRFKAKFRIYALRHTGISLPLLAGVPLKVVSERAGHSTIVLTANTYGHLIGDMAQEPADKLEAMFGT